MANFPGVETVFVFHIYLLSSTSLHQLKVMWRKKHPWLKFCWMCNFVNPGVASFGSPVSWEQRHFARTRFGESLTLIWHLQSRAVGAVLIPRSLLPSPWQPGLPRRCGGWCSQHGRLGLMHPFSCPSHPSPSIFHFDSQEPGFLHPSLPLPPSSWYIQVNFNN